MKLIDKDVLIAEIEKRINEEIQRHATDIGYSQGCVDSMRSILSFLDIDIIDMKDVNLDFQTFAKEMDAVFDLPSTETTNTDEDPLNWEYAIAKHFFELGMNAKNVK